MMSQATHVQVQRRAEPPEPRTSPAPSEISNSPKPPNAIDLARLDNSAEEDDRYIEEMEDHVDSLLSERPDDLPVHMLVSALCSGRIHPTDVSRETRVEIVGHLMLQGYDSTTICSFTGMASRTVRRHLADFRKTQALDPNDATLGPRMLGEIHQLAYASIERLTRLAMNDDLPAQHRIAAEKAIHEHYHRLVEAARKLGYLKEPTLSTNESQ